MGDHLLDGGAGRLQVLTGIEVCRVLGEVLTNGGRHGQAQIGVNVDLANGKRGCAAQLILGHTDGAGHTAAVSIDLLHELLRYAGGTVQHNGKTGQTAGNLLQHIEAKLRLGAGLELVGAVTGADSNGQRITAGLGDELLHFLGMGIGGSLGRNHDFILNAGQGAQLRFHHNTVVVGIFHHLAGNGNVLGKRLGGCVDHNGGKAVFNTGAAGLKAVAVIQMQHDGQTGFNDSSFHQLL